MKQQGESAWLQLGHPKEKEEGEYSFVSLILQPEYQTLEEFNISVKQC